MKTYCDAVSATSYALSILKSALTILQAGSLLLWVGSRMLAETTDPHLNQPRLSLQVGQPGAVKVLAFSPHGPMLASGGLGNVVKLWDLRTRMIIRTFAARGDSGVAAVAFSPDGKILAAGGPGRDVELWNTETGELLRTLPIDRHDVWSIAFSRDGKTVATGGGSLCEEIRLWEVQSGKMRLEFIPTEKRNAPRTHYVIGCTVVFSRDGTILATGGSDRIVRVWNAKTGKLKHKLIGHRDSVLSLAFASTGTLLASASADGTVKVWDAGTGQIKQTLTADALSFASVSFSLDSKTLLGGSTIGPIRVWNLQNPSLSYTLLGHRSYVWSLAFSPNGKTLASGSGDGTVRLWDGRRYHPKGVLTSQAGAEISSLAFGDDGNTLAIGGDQGRLRLWDIQTGRQQWFVSGAIGKISCVAFSPGGGTIAAGGDRSIEIWDLHSRQSKKLDGHLAIVNGLAFSPDGKTLASASDDKTLKIWDVQTARLKNGLPDHHGQVYSVEFSPDGKTIASGGEGTEIILWDSETGAIRNSLDDHSGRVKSIAFSPDGTSLATGNVVSRVESWDLKTGTQVRTFTTPPYVLSHEAEVESVAFSPDGKTLASASSDKTVRLWNPQTGQLKGTLLGHTDAVRAAVFSRTQPLLVTGGNDATLRLWNAVSGGELATFVPFGKEEWVIVSQDGRFDASNLDRIAGFAWVFADAAFSPLPPEIFMRDYYEPRLLPRLLGCIAAESHDADACKKQFQDTRPLAELNRIQPEVKILGVRRGRTGDEALVEVEALGKKDPTQPNGKIETAAYDLRLFRNGQLVGQWPEPEHGMAGLQEPTTWRKVSTVPTPTHTFPVRLAVKERGQSVIFTAYAFNEDRVKSETTPPTKYIVPEDVPPRKPKAYVITIGINSYDNHHRNLEFAVKDAQDMAFALQQIRDYEVESVSLLSEPPTERTAVPVSQATKAKIRAVLGVLAGRSEGGELNGVADAEKLAKATPDDLLILTFSGHGYTEHNGTFYLLPSDSGKEDAVTPTELKKFISSEELSEWLRDVDAGEMAMIIDACHSAASVQTPGFKPGPMGDRGLGQLAYDKGMRILAASQADDVALEIQNLHQGLLTYALVRDGFQPGDGGQSKADLNGDGVVTLEEWLKYGEQRTPSLYEDAKAGKVKMVFRDSTVNPAFINETTRRAQTPSLFDFRKQNDNVVIHQPNAGNL